MYPKAYIKFIYKKSTKEPQKALHNFVMQIITFCDSIILNIPPNPAFTKKIGLNL